jgi:hypothetical protein
MYTQKEKNLMRHETTGAKNDKSQSRKKRGSSSQRGDPPDYKKTPPKISTCQLSAACWKHRSLLLIQTGFYSVLFY